MKLILGLGNPGRKYENTRHNAGFMAADFLAEHFSFPPFKESARHKALISEGQIGDEKVLLAKPLTYMNLSGQSARSLVDFYKLDLSDLLFIYDEVEIESGKIRIRLEGSAGGHNGVKSMIQELGTSQLARIRIGIKPLQPFPGKLEDYVLGELSEGEKVNLDSVFEKLLHAVELILKGEIEEAMQKYN